MSPIDVWEFKIKKFLESKNITDLSKIVLIPFNDKVEIVNDGIFIGVIR